jgi:methylglutaconyl-CoA hydratase
VAYRFLITERRGPIEHLTLNRPDVRNALNDDVIFELAAWASAMAHEQDVRVVVLSGAGKTFSAGADVTWMAKAASYTEDENVRDATALSEMFASLDQLPVPLIGRLHGAALGGGVGLAAVCDIVIAEHDTVFGFTEVKLGIIPAVISPFAIAKIGRSAARELFLSGARFSATRAREIGLVHQVVPLSELDRAVETCIQELLGAGPQAIAAAKSLISRVAPLPIGQAGPITARAIAERRASAEGQEGMKAFLQKRKPSWAR